MYKLCSKDPNKKRVYDKIIFPKITFLFILLAQHFDNKIGNRQKF
jgi:hypothetical protein